MGELAVSVDIGSTWTKGALVDLADARLLERRETPTTVADLSVAFETVWASLVGSAERLGTTDVETYLSSSAKGGLRIAAIGIVPDLTLKAARLAAASAGGKVIAAYSYALSSRDIAALQESSADLVLLAGGTDGGDESYVRKNAAILADSPLGSAFVYAGNSAARDEVLAILRGGGKRAVGADNILPEIDRLEYGGARSAIAELFLERIIEGKGLAAVRERCDAAPKATPAAVFDLVRTIDAKGALGAGFLAVDMGGATTDVYSACEPFVGRADTVFRGIPEPRVKRSVEGDLGLRVSARTLLEAAGGAERTLGPDGEREIAAWVEGISAAPDRLPLTERERDMDAFLARVCLSESIRRHAGSVRGVYTASGLVWVQAGKDLADIRTCIGTGGALARAGSSRIMRAALRQPRTDEGAATPASGRSLLPDGDAVRYLRDAGYLFPLAANLAENHPDAAVELALAGLAEDANGDAP